MSSGLEDLDNRQRESWRRAAGGWEKWQEQLRSGTAPVTDWLVQAIDPQPGQQLLELAAGPGETGFVAAQRIVPGGRLISSDQSEEMVATARRRAVELGLENVEFMVLDAQRNGLDAASFDAVLCRFGYMLMTEPDLALRHTHRVLRPGGRLALAAWDTPDHNLWMAAPVIQLISRGLFEPPDPSAPGPFSMADRGRLEQRLADAGFRDIECRPLEFTNAYPSFARYWEMTLDLAGPVTAALEPLDAEAIAEIREAVRGALAQFIGADGQLAVPARAVVARATA